MVRLSGILTVYVFDKYQALSLSPNIEYVDLGIENDVIAKKTGRPEKDYILNSTKHKRFNRWDKKVSVVNVESFKKFLNESKNDDLSSADRKAMWEKFESKMK